MADWDLFLLRQKINRWISKAIESGDMARSDTCELCGDSPSPITVTRNDGFTYKRSKIVFHHWRGYEGDAALDVWGICQHCNSILRGPRFHNGTVTKEQARQFVLDAYNAPPKIKSERCKYLTRTSYQCGNYVGKNQDGYCYQHNLLMANMTIWKTER